MGHLIKPDYSVQFLFPPSLEELLPANHPARFIREYVDSMDLPSLGFQPQNPVEGRPPYDQGLLLKCWIYGYMNKIRSYRALEKACRDHLPLLWLTGMHYPDHNSLWRFFRTYHKLIRQLFLHSVKVACQMELVGYVLYAVDGTKIQAASAGRSALSREQLSGLLTALEAQIHQVEEQLLSEPEPAAALNYALPESLRKTQALKEKLAEAKKVLETVSREKVHPGEPEARFMVCEGRKRLAYNAQAVADSQEKIIVAADLINQETDQQALFSMVSQAIANTDRVPQTVAADSGYAVAEQVQKTLALGPEVLTPPPEGQAAQDRYHYSHFTYEESTDQFICPAGQRLTFERENQRSDRDPSRCYRCHQAACPVRDQCTKDPRGRTLQKGPGYEILKRQREKLQDPAQRKLYDLRKTVIEPVFATVKEVLGFRRWMVRGQEKVAAQWFWLCWISNLKILMKHWGSKRVAA